VIAQKTSVRRAVTVAATGVAILLAVAILLLPTPSSQPAQGKLTFAIAPGSNSSNPQDVAKTMAALRELKPPGRTLVVHLYSGYAGRGSWRYYRALVGPAIESLERSGFDVELVVRYAPLRDRGSPKDVRGFAALVRRIVTTFGSNRRFVSIQITNEPDLAETRASDGYFNRADAAWRALIRGVITAKAAARENQFDQLRVGFNYASTKRAFWRYLGRYGGPSFARSLDWVGIDTYAGTLTPLPASGLRRGIADAIRRSVHQARHVFLPLAGIPGRVALHFSENGYATGGGHSYAMQTTALETAVDMVASLSRASHVTEYDWFELRDASDSSSRLQSQLGLLTHDYRPKPAFSTYRRLIQDFG
jgi:hypothetical protein